MRHPDEITLSTLENFQKSTHLPVQWTTASPLQKQSGMDGTVTITFTNGQQAMLIQCKKVVPLHEIPRLIACKKQYPNFAIMAQTIYPTVRQELRDHGIGYWDTAGNAFLDTGEHFILIEGNQKPLVAAISRGRAFTKAGLKIVFNLLLQPDLVNENYRTLAAEADVSLDTVHKTYQSLKQLGYLIPLDQKRVKLLNVRDLLDRWISDYDSKLKPTLHLGNFRFLKEEDFYQWKSLRLKNRLTQWGGEPAADWLTEYLRPEVLTLYTEESKNELIRNYRLVPDPHGKVQVYQKFWKYDEVNYPVVPPLLIYTDLVNTGDPRNRETAQLLDEQFLQNLHVWS